MTTLGIDIGGSSVKAAIVEDRIVTFSGQSSSYTKPSADELIHAIQCVLAPHPPTAFDAVGICVPGLLDERRRMITHSVNVPGLNGLLLDGLVALSIRGGQAPVHILNDAVASATDVVIARSLKGRIAALALGTGVGMGILDDGRPLHVEGSSPGHIGQTDVSLPGEVPIGPDGGAGSLEAYIGAPALIGRYGSTEAFLRAAQITDPPLLALARAIRIIHAIYRPNHIVLVGGIGIRLKHLIPALKQQVDTHLTNIARSDWTLDAGDHDFHAASGAARLAAEEESVKHEDMKT